MLVPDHPVDDHLCVAALAERLTTRRRPGPKRRSADVETRRENARDHHHNPAQTPAVRNVFKFLVAEVDSHRRLLQIDRRLLAGYRDRFSHCRDFHRSVDRRRGADPYGDALDVQGRKTRKREADRIVATWQLREAIAARLICNGGSRALNHDRAGHRHFHSWDQRPGDVLSSSRDRSVRRSLRERRHGQHHNKNEDCKKISSTQFHLTSHAIHPLCKIVYAASHTLTSANRDSPVRQLCRTSIPSQVPSPGICFRTYLTPGYPSRVPYVPPVY